MFSRLKHCIKTEPTRFSLVLRAYFFFLPLYFSLLSSPPSSSSFIPTQSHNRSLLFFPLLQPGSSCTVLPPLIDGRILIGKRWVCLIMRPRKKKKKGWRTRGMEIDWEKKRIREGGAAAENAFFLWHGLLTLAGLSGYFSVGFETEIHRGC